MNNALKELYFKSYKNLIIKISNDIAKKYHYFDKDELISEAFLIFTKTLDKWDSTQQKLTTFIYYQLTGYLKEFILKQKRMNNYMLKSFILENKFDITYKQKIVLSEEIKIILNILSADCKKTKEDIKKELRNMGWSFKQIYQTFNTIKYNLKEELI